MKTAYVAGIMLVALAMPLRTAHAQAAPDPAGQTQGAGATQPAQTGAGSSSAQTSNSSSSGSYSGNFMDDQFILSGAVGGSFGGDADNGGVAFDGTFDWVRHGKYGLELIGAFSPNFNFGQTTLASAGDTQTNSYMFNVVGAAPIGNEAAWLPYVSGGFGAITVRNTLDLTQNNGAAFGFTNTNGSTSLSLIDNNQFGGNIGFGLMGFMNQVGFRADVRYFSGIGNNDSTTNSSTTGTVTGSDANTGLLNNLLQNVSFWRSTVGVSFRW